jgi:Ca2+/Na+ antiporter
MSIAKAGYGEMAVSGSIAGPLFNVLIGLGVSLIKKNIQIGDIEFSLFDFDKKIILLISTLFLILNLIRLLIHSVILKFKLTPSVSYLGFLTYILFIAGILFFTFK